MTAVKSKKIQIIPLAISIVVCQLAGFLGSVFTIPSIPGWYAGLTKPFFNPPSWVFGPVWTTLYLLMAIAAYLIWASGSNNKTVSALKIFGVQLILNVFWSLVFFGIHEIVWGFIVIVALWVAIFITIKQFKKINSTASLLLWPYLAWVSFATLLNFSLLILNP